MMRPNWTDVYQNPRETFERSRQMAELVAVTRHTLELARSAIDHQQGEDYYHNFAAARDEIERALAQPHPAMIPVSEALRIDDEAAP